MSDRDRLIKLICDTPTRIKGSYMFLEKISTEIADYLIANGVSVPTIPIGATVYEIRARGKRRALSGYRKCDYGISTNLMLQNALAKGLELYIKEKSFVKYDMTRWNKTVFATAEQAEAKLKECEGK